MNRKGFSDDVCGDWMSEGPNIDIRHRQTFTSIKLDPENFKVLPENYREINYNQVPEWDLKALFDQGIKNHSAHDFSDFEV